MYEWLDAEISAIKTPGFHSVDGPKAIDIRDTKSRSQAALPEAYKEFVLKFGNAKLYRDGGSLGYRLSVFAVPKEKLVRGELVYQLGNSDGAIAYIKPKLSSGEFPIFEFEDGEEDLVANDFGEWLQECYSHIRKSYGKEKWTEILNGPHPFTLEERTILALRHQMKWCVLGIDSQGNHQIQVTNEGKHILPFLTLGARSRDSRLNGAVRLKIDKLLPGQTNVLHVDCYKNLVSPDEVEVFSLPDPKPENRELYWELKVNWTSQL